MPFNLPLARKLFADHRVAIFSWLVALVCVTAVYASFFGVMQDSSITQALSAYPEALREAFDLDDVGTPAGYLNSTVFALAVPIMIVILAIQGALWVSADDESSGTLDLLLAQPIARTRLLAERSLAVVGVLVAATVCVFGTVCAVGVFTSLNVPIVNTFAACVHLLGLGLAFAGLTVGVAAATGLKGLATGVVSAYAVVGYLCSNFLHQFDGLAWLRFISPFFYSSGHAPVVHGFNWGDLGVLVTITVIAGVAGALVFARRDVRSV